jgi:outer membrane lipoprotein-sorting protein
MKKLSALFIFFFVLGASLGALAQASGSAELQTVLKLMDQTAANFRSVETDFTWDQFERVVNEHTYQKGVMYFHRAGATDVEMAADIKPPGQKYVLFKEGKVRVYEPNIDQLTIYDAGKNKADFEAFLVLGFGGSGHDLARNFEVRYAGIEQPGGVSAYKLELTPKSERARGMFSLITLWIDRERGIAVQQRFDESSGNHRLAQYSNIKLNQKLPAGVFTLKTTRKTKIVQPQSGG